MLNGFELGLIACVYSVMLTDSGMILSSVNGWLQQRLPEWLYFPLMGCERCVAGQLSLWYCVFHQRGIESSALCVAVSIASAFLFKSIYVWIKRKG